MTRDEALRAGEPRYFTGEPCRPRGHVADRYTLCMDCVECKRIRMMSWRAANAEKHKQDSLRWQRQNPKRKRLTASKWEAANPERVRAIADRRNAKKRERRAALSH